MVENKKYKAKIGDRLKFSTTLYEGNGIYEITNIYKHNRKKALKMVKVGKRGKKLSEKYDRNILRHYKGTIESVINNCSKKYGRDDIQKIEPIKEGKKPKNQDKKRKQIKLA